MEWEDEFKLDLLQTEMDRIASTNKTYLKLEKERQDLLLEMKQKLNQTEYELVEKLVDITEIQNFLMIRAVLRIGLV